MEDTIVKELEEWLIERHIWLQDATNRIISNSILSEKDIDKLVLICKREAGVPNDINDEISIKKVSKGTLKSFKNSYDMTLDSISNLIGIGALAPRKPLEFGDKPLCIVYGRNGSGKSSYVKALKHACGARKPGILRSDVYKQENLKQGCTFHIKQDTLKKVITWSSDNGIHDELKAIEIYDTDCAQVYVNLENEITYEPTILSFLTQLTDCCTKVNLQLQKEIDQNVSKKPILPEEYRTTISGIWYSKLSHKISDKEIASICLWNENLEKDLSSLEQRLLEKNPSEKAKLLRKKKSSIVSILQYISQLLSGLSTKECTSYLLAKKDVFLKRKVAAEDAKKVFENAPLEGIGTDSWKLLWMQARAYSEAFAYCGSVFPNITESSRCVLCHQSLNEETKKRLDSFEKFIKDNLEKQVEEAETLLKKLSDIMVQVPKEEIIDLLLTSSEVTNEVEVGNIKYIFESFRRRKDSLFKTANYDEINEMPDTSILNSISEQIKAIEEQACVFEKDAASDNRSAIQINIKELEAQKWMFQQRKIVDEETAHLQKIYYLVQAQNLTSTQRLSKKKSELSDKLITDAYIERFQNELESLGASHIKVELAKTRTQKGHTLHQVKLKGCADKKCAEILSDGELRIVSLAAFLADVEGRKVNTPFIFDDPISSLDQEYEEATVKRLIELCAGRQVIVFTHRLTLLSLLEDAAKQKSIETSIICLRSETWGAGEPSETSINIKKPDAALRAILNDRLSKARNIFNNSGYAEYEPLAKGICSDFRTLIERFVESFLINGVVVRFRKDVQTKDKLHKLAVITKEDCDLFEGLMTTYSKYEHSQSIETPMELPFPDKLMEDMEKLRDWYYQFCKRD